MKNKIILNFFFLLTSLFGFSQQNNFLKYSQVFINANSINLNRINLVSNLNLINTGEIYLDELANEETEIYIKNNSNPDFQSNFYFKDDRLYGFNLLDNQFYLNSPNLKVGNNISTINSVYPLSYSNKYSQNNLGFMIVDLKMEDNSFSDEMIVINYNLNTKLITSIHLASK